MSSPMLVGGEAERLEARRVRRLAPLVLVGGAAGGLAAAELAASGKPMLVAVFVAAGVPLLIWKWAEAPVLLPLGIAAVVEQFAYTAGPGPGGFTDPIPLFARGT